MSLLLLSGGLPRIRLLDPGRKDPRLSFARAQLAGVESTYLGPDGATWQVAAADVLRFQGAGRRALFEGQRTNLLASARTTGGVGYANTNIASVEAAVGPDGLAGTASLITETTDGSALSHQILCSDTASIVSGTTYTMTCIVKPGACSTVQIVGRTGAFGTAVWANYDLSGAGSVGTYGASVSRATITRTGSWYVISCSGPASATGTLAPWALVMSTSATDSRSPAYVGTGRAFTAGWSWVEQAAFASAPILPPVASPAASTRGADLASAAWSWRRGVILWSGRWLQTAPSGIDQTAFQLDDASDSNRFRIRNAAGGATVVAGRVTSGSAVDATTLGSMTAGTTTSLGLAVDLDTGAYKALLRGGSVQSGTGGPTAASALRAANNYAAAAAMFGEIERFQVIPGLWPSDAHLAAEVNNMPLAA